MSLQLVWDIATSDWVGPIATVAVVNGQPVGSITGVQFAVSDERERPAESDWQAPVVDPAGSAGYGLIVAATDREQVQGLWARYVSGSSSVTLGPSVVGSIRRTVS